MKKINFLCVALFATMCSLFMVSCDDDDATIDENEVPNGTEVINYSIQIIPTSLNGKVAGLADVKVTVNQNGTKQTKTTDASGIVAFDKFKEGPISIYVQGPAGFVSVNTTDILECQNCVFGDNDSEQTEYDQNTITLPRTGASLKGKLFGDVDFNGTIAAAEVLPNTAVVIAKLDAQYEPNVYKTNVGTDGTFQFTTLPEGVNVNLSLDFKKVNTITDPTKPFESTFTIPGQSDGPWVLDINNPRVLGNIDTTHN